MDELKELIAVINKQVIKRIEVMGNSTNYSSKMRKLYDGISAGELSSDEAAAKLLYNSSPDNVNYKKLKYRLQQRLINTVFFIDVSQSQFNENQKAYFNCWKDWAAAKILIGKAARLAPLEIAEKILLSPPYFDL